MRAARRRSDGCRAAARLVPRHPLRAAGSAAGFTLVELLFVLGLATTVMAVAIPSTRDAIEGLHTAAAARYVSARLTEARLGAIARSTSVGLRFEPDGDDYRLALFVDGNGNGVRATDIALGIDVASGRPERLHDKFPGVAIGLLPGYPDADSVMGTGGDGVRMGRAQIASMSPDGTATPGTVYLHGRRTQFAVRILGSTGRVRVLRYEPAEGQWVPH